METRLSRGIGACAFLALTLSACSGHHDGPDYSPEIRQTTPIESKIPVYRFGVQPEGSARRQWDRFQPLVAEINKAVEGFSVRFETAQYQELYRNNLKAGEYDLALIEPHDVGKFKKSGYNLVATIGRADGVAGVIVARLDADIEYLIDLKKKRLAFGKEHELSTMLVRQYVRPDLPALDRLVDTVYTASDASAFLAAFNGNVHAAAGSLRGWKEFLAEVPDAEKTLELKWETRPLSGRAFMAHPRVKAAHLAKLTATLCRLHASASGRKALQSGGLHAFRRADAAAYADVRGFLRTYARAFPPVRQKELAR